MNEEIQVLEVSVSAISINPYQPRRSFEKEALEELAASIKSVGIIHPPVVRMIGENQYELIAGERRFRAAQLGGLETIPVMIRKINTSKSAETSLIENIHRVDLNAIEIAKALRRLMVDFGLTQDELAHRVNMKRSTVANYLRLLTLPNEAQEALLNRQITMGHAKALLAVEDVEKQVNLLKKIVRNQLSVRDVEKAGKKRMRPLSPKEGEQDIHLKYFQEALQRRLGTKVTIQGNEKKGKITIDYFSLDDIDRVMEILEIRDEVV